VRNNVTIAFFGADFVCVLGITSAGDRANIFEEEYRNQDSLPVATPLNGFASDPCRIRNLSFDLSTRAGFRAELRKWDTHRRKNLFIPNSLWIISLIVGTVAVNCCVINRALGKGYFSRIVLSCGLRVKGGRPGRGTSLQDISPFRTFWSHLLI
jgi:hypothetical protein